MVKAQFKKLMTITAALLVALILLSLMPCGGAVFASAASGYSNVLEDLKKDPQFNAADYPAGGNDYKLEVVQIAESEQGELLIYCYLPNDKLRPEKINIARELDNDPNLKFVSYHLILQSSNGVFFKYSVDGFELSTDTIRYYNISNILRSFINGVDKEPADGQIISEVENKVAQIWTVETVDDTVTYSVLTSEVVTIENKVVGYCAYDDGLNLGWGAMQGLTKAYFVAFSTDKPIDKLISADLTFFATRLPCKICLNDKHDHDLLYDFGEAEYIDFGTGVYNDTPLTITHTQKFSNQGGGNWLGRPANKYTWNRIRKTSDFIADNNNKDYELVQGEKLNGTEWVLNFYECQDKCKVNNVWLSFIPGVSSIKGVADGDCELNNVFEVEILRLEFETDGVTYNLGVVDNVQSGDNFDPFNKLKPKNLPWWVWVILIVLAVSLVVGLALLISKPFRGRRERRERKRTAKPKPTKKRSKPKKSKGGKK